MKPTDDMHLTDDELIRRGYTRRYEYETFPLRFVDETLRFCDNPDAYISDGEMTRELRRILDHGFRWIRSDGDSAIFERVTWAKPSPPDDEPPAYTPRGESGVPLEKRDSPWLGCLLAELKALDGNGWAIATDGSLDHLPNADVLAIIEESINAIRSNDS